jgi:hypothetical protein
MILLTAAFVGGAAPTTKNSTDGTLPLESFLERAGKRLSISVTLECDERHEADKHSPFLTLQVPRGDEVKTADDLQAFLRQEVSQARIERDEDKPEVWHLVEQTLPTDDSYLMNARLSVQFAGAPTSLLNHLTDKSGGRIGPPKDHNLNSRCFDVSTKVNVSVEEKSYRSIISACLPLAEYSRILWIAEVHKRANLEVAEVRFQGMRVKNWRQKQPGQDED